MKTKTITYHNAHNYGAVLQAYALQQSILLLDIENEIINYHSNKCTIFNKFSRKIGRQTISEIVTNLATIVHYRDLKNKYNLFEKFINTELALTEKYENLVDLINIPPEADCYITGSDQVWNVFNGAKREFFLDFGDKKTKRVSYAASIGIYDISQKNKEEFFNLIKKFDKISVREKQSKTFIEKESNKKCCVNIDPVFLLAKERWAQISNKTYSCEKYILCYPLLHHPLLNEALKKLKDSTGYKVIILNPNARTKIKGDKIIRNAGPREFLNLFENAEIILTTSFHGVAFSIINEKKFFSFINSHAPSRINNILNILGLEDRIVNDINDVISDEINYSNVNKLKKSEVDKSIKYLKDLYNLDE